jgi:hypothetical protein
MIFMHRVSGKILLVSSCTEEHIEYEKESFDCYRDYGESTKEWIVNEFEFIGII